MSVFYKYLLGGIAALITVFLLIPGTRDTAFFILFIVPLGAILGPFSYLAHPFSGMDKIFYALALILSIVLMVVGIKCRKKWWGHLLGILAVILWCVLGILGLGTLM